jgi:hypothetical protein
MYHTIGTVCWFPTLDIQTKALPLNTGSDDLVIRSISVYSKSIFRYENYIAFRVGRMSLLHMLFLQHVNSKLYFGQIKLLNFPLTVFKSVSNAFILKFVKQVGWQCSTRGLTKFGERLFTPLLFSFKK